jgi:hypothetical protein
MSHSPDKQLLVWRYGHAPVGTDLKQCVHSGEYAGIRLEGQDRKIGTATIENRDSDY